jgi:peptide/nickel transport system substrate-binding protein
MNKKRLILAITLLSLLPATLSLAGGGIFRVSHPYGYGAATSLDPISPSPFWQANEKLMNRLVRPSVEGEPMADLALSWSSNESATEWTFNLRKGVKFHDGSDFDAADVVYSLMRIKDPKLEAPVAAIISVVEAVEAVDAFTVKIKLSSPHADLPMLLMDYRFKMLPEGSGDTIAQTGIGTGPYTLVTLDAEGTTVLKANPNYWGGTPGVETIKVIAIPDAQARVQAMLSGQIDMLRHISAQEKILFANNPKFKLQFVPTGDWQAGIVFRTDIKPFDDVRVRKAVRIAANRQQMVDLVLGPKGGVVTCDHPVWTGDQYRTELSCPQDIDEAKRLLAEAGYPDGIEIDVITSDIKPLWINMVQVYQQQVALAGITVNLVKVPADGYWSDIWMKEPVISTGWGQRPADQVFNEAYRSTASWNESFLKLPEFDKKLDMARQELDFDKRKALYGELQKMLFEKGGTFIPFHVNQVVVLSNRVSGIAPVFDDALTFDNVTISQ